MFSSFFFHAAYFFFPFTGFPTLVRCCFSVNNGICHFTLLVFSTSTLQRKSATQDVLARKQPMLLHFPFHSPYMLRIQSWKAHRALLSIISFSFFFLFFFASYFPSSSGAGKKMYTAKKMIQNRKDERETYKFLSNLMPYYLLKSLLVMCVEDAFFFHYIRLCKGPRNGRIIETGRV